MNRAMPLDLGLVRSIRVNAPMVQARAGDILPRHAVKGPAQVLAYLLAVKSIDLTTLSGDDTFGKVDRLCGLALNPLNEDLLRRLGHEELIGKITCGAVCVYYNHVSQACDIVEGRIPIASVSTDFPDGENSPHDLKLKQIEAAINAGATEIDVVITRSYVLRGEWEKLYQEILDFRRACGTRAKLKVILAVGNLGSLQNVAMATAVAIMAGADTVKTSTGKEPVNATLANSLVMVRQMRRFMERVYLTCRDLDGTPLAGQIIGFKPAGGIQEAVQAQAYMALMHDELSPAWTTPDRFRIGASTLLLDLQMQLDHCVDGEYSSPDHHARA